MKIAFLGHSDFTLTTKLKTELINKIKGFASTNKRVDAYLGGYGNFDIQCLSLLRELKVIYPSINTVFITPYLNSSFYKLKYAKQQYDDIIYPPIENTPLKFAISKRNDWIVDNCDYIICYIIKHYGGAYRAYKRATNKKIPCFNLADFDNL